MDLASICDWANGLEVRRKVPVSGAPLPKALNNGPTSRRVVCFHDTRLACVVSGCGDSSVRTQRPCISA